MAAISSRTPEGSHNRCPVCGNEVRVETSLPFGDAPCPACGHLLWFLTIRSEQRFFTSEDARIIQERLDRIADDLGLSRDALTDPARLNDAGLDSLDIAELLTELEEELG